MKEAVIFDMDGIVIDSEHIHSLAFKEVLSEYGIFNIPEGIIHIPGLGSKDNWEILKQKFGFNEDTYVLVAKRRRSYLRALKNRLEPRTGLLKLLSELSERGFTLALATSSTSSVDVILDGLNIRRYFAVVISGVDVTNTKPNPEIFLKTIAKLETDPDECLAIEDASAGVIAAKRAGIKCIAVPTSCTMFDDFSEADLVLNSLELINANLVATIIGSDFTDKVKNKNDNKKRLSYLNQNSQLRGQGMILEDKLSIDEKKTLDVLRNTVTKLYNTAKGLEGAYVPHDETHCIKVEEYLNSILSADYSEYITPKEYYLLLCGVWLHDIGMIPQLFGNDDITEMDKIRKMHHNRSAEYVDTHWLMLGLELDDAEKIIPLCLYHRRSEHLEDLDNDPKLQYLVSLLRLADVCHSDYTRIPEDRYRLNLALGITPEHLLHWVKSLIVTNVEPNHNKKTIDLGFTLPPAQKWFKADFTKLIKLVIEDMNHELDGIKDYLNQYEGFTFTKVRVVSIGRISRHTLDWGIYEALCAYEITRYPSAKVVFDSVLETLYVIGKKAEVDRIEERMEKALKSAIKEKKHHLGLVFLKEEVERACKDKKGVSLREALLNSVTRLRKWEDEAQLEIANHALMSDIISTGDCILAYGYSSCIIKLFESVPKDMRGKLKVYIGETRSKSKYDMSGKPEYNDCLLYTSPSPRD